MVANDEKIDSVLSTKPGLAGPNNS